MTSFPFWPTEIRFPGSEYNRQTIAPVTNWLSPTFVTADAYAGDHRIEERIVTEVASFGKQLGILTDALLELADEAGGGGSAVHRLREVAARINTVKFQNIRSLEDRATEAFEALRKADQDAAQRFVDRMETMLVADPADATD